MAALNDAHVRFHEQWLGMVQPSEGLVFSVPVLAEAQVMDRTGGTARRRLLAELCPDDRIADLRDFFARLLDLDADAFDDAPPDDLSLYVTEGQQTLRPTLALRDPYAREAAEDAPPAVRAGAAYAALVWDLPVGLALDKPEVETGAWRYPPGAKFDRLLRACRTPVGLVTNREVVRLVYAPHGQSSGWIDFRIKDMASAGGAPILDAFVSLLRAERWFGVAEEHALPRLLADSRNRQADVTNELAEQVFAALAELLAGFDRANERDPRRLLDRALEEGTVYGGLLTVLLRVVFLLYAEEHGLLPVEHPLYGEHFSVLGLYDRLLADAGAHPDEMSRRFGAWPRLLAVFRAVYFGVEWHGSGDALVMPARQGELFDPDRYPWLEGRASPGASLDPAQNVEVRTPSLDDGTVLALLDRLIVVEGQRLSYKALDVEQIGSVYERLMGFRVQRLEATAVCLRPSRVWVTGVEVLGVPANQRARWLQDEAALARAEAGRLASALSGVDTPDAALDMLEKSAYRGHGRASGGRLVLQPGSERRRTSSHYTPRSLSGPIVQRTLEPLLRTLGPDRTADQILSLKVCDPAMGSGAFLVEACRYLAGEVEAAWIRSGQASELAATVPDLATHARRLVAQKCLYGVDKNPFAVGLARLSLWLVTMARDLPFTFVDHALRAGDSLVGLSFEQIGGFHWAPEAQLSLFTTEIRRTLDDTVELRQQILALASSPDTAEKERLLHDADVLTGRVRLIADVVVGAFFACEKPAAREKERKRRLALVEQWLRDDDPSVYDELVDMQRALHAQVTPFHWMVEFPEVFYAEREDPLAGGARGVAFMDAFVGNPPFLGGRLIRGVLGGGYLDWIGDVYTASKNADLCAFFFLRTAELLGQNGTLGLIATNTIAQGDTREAGLARLVESDQSPITIFDVTESMPWPGEAAVTVSVVHGAKGSPAAGQLEARLNGVLVAFINSHLRAEAERMPLAALNANRGRCFQGAVLAGIGFTLTPDEREELVQRWAGNADRIRPYIGGQEVNNSPRHDFDRFVIDFGDMSLDHASQWFDLISIVRARVKPERDGVRRETHRRFWWHFGDKRPALGESLRHVGRCLVNSQVSKHLVFAWQPTDRVFGHTLYVYPIDGNAWFAVLQSRVHERWAWLLSSSLEGRLRYSPTDCFETFPFPADMADPALEAAGEALYTARADYMVRHDQGLTATYNQLKDPDCHDPEIEHLRRLHEAMDRAVLRAYGWDDIDVPPYGTAAPEPRQAFEDEVVDRLFVLNAQRAEEEKSVSLNAAPAKPKKPRAPKKPKPGDDDGQPSLL